MNTLEKHGTMDKAFEAAFRTKDRSYCVSRSFVVGGFGYCAEVDRAAVPTRAERAATSTFGSLKLKCARSYCARLDEQGAVFLRPWMLSHKPSDGLKGILEPAIRLHVRSNGRPRMSPSSSLS